MTFGFFGLPTMEGKTALGASSPENPHLHMPDPLSTTSGTASVSNMMTIAVVLW
eukprot:CAMPEP_0117447326 /NCGR_PEP_ID=MMETSP0759-20121206/6816_1 /TAXON_ID=63605 /ORGANISM="Percolomonas cosmopolitus, Strain WS" /LENGTH=53 /DNA_ID=CAMNT_0005239655 /DNA_START=167 /DNA_END=325 /DNA_ORIENTATION=-